MVKAVFELERGDTKDNNRLNNFLEKTYEYVSILFNFPKNNLKRLVKDFVNKIKGM